MPETDEHTYRLEMARAHRRRGRIGFSWSVWTGLGLDEVTSFLERTTPDLTINLIPEVPSRA